MHSRVDQQSVELTASTMRTIRTTWVVITPGSVDLPFAIALSIVQVEVVQVISSVPPPHLDVAQGRLASRLATQNRPNEIGEMSRAPA